jgi:hypothetical protein
MAMTRTRYALIPTLLLALAWSTSALAQQPMTALDGKSPSITQVSAEHRRTAMALVEAGNKLLNDSFFPQAEKKYSAALAIWDHPAIHYNLALSLPQTLKPTQVYDHMLAALKHGEAPLGEGRFKHARNLTERMRREYAWVEITCDCEASAKLASGEWLERRGSGRFEGLVPPGTHTLVAAQKDQASTETILTLAAGERVRLRLGSKRPWATWMPWAVLGAGVAVASGGGLLHAQAGERFRAFDRGINECDGCVPSPQLAGERTRALNLQRGAVTAYAVGGAALVTGLVLLYNNQLQSQVIPETANESQLVVMPVLGGSENGVQATFRF